jgi:hypothetical protein
VSTKAEVIADSISEAGDRLTTLQVTLHRFVLAEFNTHRVFSRNSASSRAIPLRKQIERVRNDLAMPVSFPMEQKGMQGGEELDEQAYAQAQSNWALASRNAIEAAEAMGRAGVHKSVANRLLEPFMWHTVVVTATAWANFFLLRDNEAAMPEIRVAAEAMKAAYDASTPRLLKDGEWHLPYITGEDWGAMANRTDLGKSMYPEMVKVSAARVARVSYLTQDGRRDLSEDLGLYKRLVDLQHASPLEQVATPEVGNKHEVNLGSWEKPFMVTLPKYGNLTGWRSLRVDVEVAAGYRSYQ